MTREQTEIAAAYFEGLFTAASSVGDEKFISVLSEKEQSKGKMIIRSHASDNNYKVLKLRVDEKLKGETRR